MKEGKNKRVGQIFQGEMMDVGCDETRRLAVREAVGAEAFPTASPSLAHILEQRNQRP